MGIFKRTVRLAVAFFAVGLFAARGFAVGDGANE
jgi:hypothetical protein